MNLTRVKWAMAGLLIAAIAGCARRSDAPAERRALRAHASDATSTSGAGLRDTIAALRMRVAQNSREAKSGIALADALLRQTRVTNNAGLAEEASRVLMQVLVADPDHYEARRMLAAVRLSQHRFREALHEAARCQTARADDAFVDGVMGDAHLELGDYPDAFAAFDRMNARKPTAASYARASYARELQGDLPQAVRFMQMAAEATPPQDVESLAWHHAELGHLALEQGRLDVARREYAHADFLFPGHPFASDGLARVAAAAGDTERALELVTGRLKNAPMPADFAFAGDLLSTLGRRDEAERHYRLAEAAWRSDVPEPSRLARFLAEHGRHLEQARQLAQATYADRHDIFTADALAWAAFRTGRMSEAREAMTAALRTGTRDRVIRSHAAAIERASGPLGIVQVAAR